MPFRSRNSGEQPNMSREAIEQILIWSYVLAIVIPFGQLLRRTGFSRWWLLLAFLPIINVVALWVFAYIKWPKAVEVHGADDTQSLGHPGKDRPQDEAQAALDAVRTALRP
jgi:hypothetical protein